MHINTYTFNEVTPVSDNIPPKNYELSNKDLITKHERLPFELLVRKVQQAPKAIRLFLLSRSCRQASTHDDTVHVGHRT